MQLDQKLGSELQENWGLDVLVRVGETWLPKLRDAGGVPAGQSSGGNKAGTDEEGEPGGKADVPLLKLFEFLTASLCLYVIAEESAGCPLRRMANVFSAARAGDRPDGWVRTGRGGAPHGCGPLQRHYQQCAALSSVLDVYTVQLWGLSATIVHMCLMQAAQLVDCGGNHGPDRASPQPADAARHAHPAHPAAAEAAGCLEVHAAVCGDALECCGAVRCGRSGPGVVSAHSDWGNEAAAYVLQVMEGSVVATCLQSALCHVFPRCAGAAEAHQVCEGICTTLLEQVNSRLWPPTLRDMAAGQLQFLMESHSNLMHLGREWQRTRVLEKAEQRRAAAADAVAAASSGASPSSSSKRSSDISMLSASGSSSGARGGSKPLSPMPFDLAALLNPAAAAALKGGQGLKQQQQPDPMEEALKAAGSHPGLVPLLSCYVGLMRTGHQMLELRGASGIVRMCFAAAMGSPSASQLLTETKATAAAVGAIVALIDLLR